MQIPRRTLIVAASASAAITVPVVAFAQGDHKDTRGRDARAAAWLCAEAGVPLAGPQHGHFRLHHGRFRFDHGRRDTHLSTVSETQAAAIKAACDNLAKAVATARTADMAAFNAFQVAVMAARAKLDEVCPRRHHDEDQGEDEGSTGASGPTGASWPSDGTGATGPTEVTTACKEAHEALKKAKEALRMALSAARASLDAALAEFEATVNPILESQQSEKESEFQPFHHHHHGFAPTGATGPTQGRTGPTGATGGPTGVTGPSVSEGDQGGHWGQAGGQGDGGGHWGQAEDQGGGDWHSHD
jgi:hypothetical protein